MPLSRRRFLLDAGLGGLAAAAAGTSARGAGGAARSPNILFIMADDLGYADLSCYGAPTIRTPAIDRLAHEGVRFTQAYANSAVCSATRTALITGRYQDRLRMGLEEPLANNRAIGLPPSHPTLPSRLKSVGYETTLIGKWHLGYLPDYDPLKSGYDHFYGMRGGALDYYSHAAGDEADLWDGPVPVSEQGYLTDLFGERAVQAVRRQAKSGHPFFLSLHFNAPHWPWEAPGDEAESKRVAGKPLFHWDGGTLETYRRMVEAMDRQVGRVLAELDRTRQARETIVVFTSDNGGERFSNTWPFTGRKTELLEGGLRVPAIVRWPGRIAARGTSPQVAMTMDWMPTLLAAAGTAPDPAWPADGIDLAPHLLRGEAPVARTVYWRYKANGQRAVRDGDYKALKIAGNSFLFNVVDDPLERANLKEREPERYRALTAKWDAWNRTMLPEIAESYTDNFTGGRMADHIATPAVDPKAVEGAVSWP